MTPAMKRFILADRIEARAARHGRRACGLGLLKGRQYMSLATVRPDGYPQATTVGYANDGLTLYFACDRGGQKVRNLRRSPRVSLTINKDERDWRKITGLSMGATAKVLKRPADARSRSRCCRASSGT